jgi:two-component system, OmpR family, response regulator
VRIVLVEDEDLLAGAVCHALRARGFAVDHAADLAAGRMLAQLHEYDAMILDRRLPDGDGLDLCHELREGGCSAPIIMLTALDGTSQIVTGLEAGADDYLTKPFATEELIARVGSLIRRGPVSRSPRLEFGEITIDLGGRRVWQRGALVPLTAKEFSLLEYFALRPGEVVDRYQLLEHCWDHAYEPGSNVVDVHVAALRRKLGGTVIATVRGAGYRLGIGADR